MFFFDLVHLSYIDSFILGGREEIRRLKTQNPNIPHKEAFSTAWNIDTVQQQLIVNLSFTSSTDSSFHNSVSFECTHKRPVGRESLKICFKEVLVLLF